MFINNRHRHMLSALENKVPPPLVAVLIGAGMWGAARWLPGIAILPSLRYALVVLMGLFAVVVAGSAIREFRRVRTTVNPIQIEKASRLVTAGVFRYTRNPMYVGIVAGLVGWAIWLAVPWVLAGPLLLAAFLHRFQILPEEQVMRAKFGAEFDEYCRRVRRWL